MSIDVEVRLPRDRDGLVEKLADFGIVALNAHASLTVRMINRGEREAVITGSEVEPPFEMDLPPGGLALPVGGEAAMVLEFEPAAEGAAERIFVLTVHSGGRAEEIRVRLAGNGIRRALRCEPEKLEFGLVPVGSSNEVSFRCENPLPLPLAVELPSLASDVAQVIGIEFDPLPAGGTIDLPPAGLFVGKMTFRPLERSFVKGSLPIVSTDGSLVATLVFQGTGVELPTDPPTCEFEVVPSILDFGVVDPGDASELRFGIRNLNQAPGPSCVVESLRLSADTDSSFSLGLEGDFEVRPQEMIDVPVVFRPVAEFGPTVGRALFVMGNGEDRLLEVELHGKAAAPCISFVTGATILDCFAGVDWVQSAIFRSNCDGVEIDAVDIVPSSRARAFQVSEPPSLPLTLAKGETAKVALVFRPEAGDPLEVKGALGVRSGSDSYTHPLVGRTAWMHNDVFDIDSSIAPTFPLTHTPADRNGDGVVDDADFQVYVDGRQYEPVDQFGIRQWWYEPESKAIVFGGDALPQPWAWVGVTFIKTCIE